MLDAETVRAFVVGLSFVHLSRQQGSILLNVWENRAEGCEVQEGRSDAGKEKSGDVSSPQECFSVKK